MNDYLERRIATLERLVYPMPSQLAKIRTKLETSGQKIQGIRSGGYGCTTTLNGMIVGGITTPMPNTSLRVEGQVTGIDYGTYSVPSGVYTIEIAGVHPNDSGLYLYPLGPSTSNRFIGATPFAYTQSINQCQVNAVSPIVPPCAPGFNYLFSSMAGTQAQLYPIGSMGWSDTKLLGSGPYGLNAGVTWRSNGCFTTNSYATGLCSAVANVPGWMEMTSNMSSLFQFKVVAVGINHCPASGTCPISTGVVALQIGGAFITSVTDAGEDTTSPYSVTWELTNILFHNSMPRTVMFFEP
jgi:hypothetical protein